MDPAKKGLSLRESVGRLLSLESHPGIPFMVFYHPAALLYDPKLRPAMARHAQGLKSFLDAHPVA
jgi:uracil-DNA glycosylase